MKWIINIIAFLHALIVHLRRNNKTIAVKNNAVKATVLGQKTKYAQRQPYRVTDKVGRNQLCPCGSGKKYKNCHLL